MCVIKPRKYKFSQEFLKKNSLGKVSEENVKEQSGHPKTDNNFTFQGIIGLAQTQNPFQIR